MRWGAELVLQLALGGEVSPRASRDALAPRGEAPKRRLEDPNKRGAPPPSGASSEPIGAGRHVLVGDPIVVPSAAPRATETSLKGPSIRASRARRGERRERLRTSDGTSPREGRARRGVERFRLRRRREWTRSLGAPASRARARRYPSRPSRRPTRRARGFEAGGDDTSLCAHVYSPRARDARRRRPPRAPSGPASGRRPYRLSAPSPPLPIPPLVDSFTQAFRVLQNAAAALVRAHDGERRRRVGARAPPAPPRSSD